jgi:hypothetical protein
MASTQKIIEQTVSTLAERYQFDAAEALAFVMEENRKASPALARAMKAVKTTETKIAELEQKIADKKVKNVEKSEETLAGLRTKLAEQNERVNSIGAPKKVEPEVVTEPEAEPETPKKKRAPRKKSEPEPEPETETEAPKKKRAPPKKPEPETETEAPKKKRAPRKKADSDTDGPAPRYGSKLASCVKKELLAAFNEAEIAWKDAYSADYKAFANAMSDEAWNQKAPLDHMKDFARTKKPVVPETVPEDAEVVTLKHNQLLKTTVVDKYGPGVYWDTDKKRFVKGPDAVDDEDANEVTFEGSTYMVGETSKRVYMVAEDNDVFVGFAGVGKFTAMTA